MTMLQWLLLILLVAVVAGAYWYIRSQVGTDPWRGMDDEAPPVKDDADDAKRGESLGGDSYIVGVRTLSDDEAEAQVNAAGFQAAGDDGEAELSWAAYKQRASEPARATSAPPADEAMPESAAEPAALADAAPDRPVDGPVEPVYEPEPARVASPAATPEAVPQTPARASEHEPLEMRAAPPAPADQQEVFILHVAAAGHRMFDGPDVHAALRAQDLKFGLNDIYHRVTEVHGVAESVFAVANMIKPGSLDPVDQDHLRTPGLVMFLVLPAPVDGVPAMRDMMETANELAQALGGEVLDDKRAVLKAQTAQYMLDQIADFDRRAKIAKRR